MKVSYDDEVFDELVSLSFYIAQDNEDAANRFLDACDATFCFWPKIGLSVRQEVFPNRSFLKFECGE